MPEIQTVQGDSAIAPPLNQLPVVVITRFSFLGSSGWKSAASRDEALLFAPERLARRLALFSAITLPSLAGQTDAGFQHLVLTSDRLPPSTLQALESACLQAYGGPGRHVILARPPSPARRPLRQYLGALHPGQTVVQVVLDDDDGLGLDFIARLRRDLEETPEIAPDITRELPFFLSYPKGYGLDFSQDGPRLYTHSYPYINLGLTMVNAASGKNVLAINHKEAPRKFGGRLIRRRRMFVRAVHGFNDSRVQPSGRWTPVEDWDADPDIRDRFPYLLPVLAARD